MKLLVVLSCIFLVGDDVAYAHQLNNGRESQQIRSSFTTTPLQFHVAPMQGYTNYAMRQLLRRMSPDAKLWTEMEKIPDLIQADTAALARRFGAPGHKDVVLQLGGNDPADIRECVRYLFNHGYSFDEINLNCGCPSIEAGGATTFGASLMKQPQLTRELVAAISKATAESDTTVSLKCRIVVYDTLEDMEREDRAEDEDYHRLHDYIEQAQQGGISHVVLHARPAILAGLSPVKNRQVPPIDYSFVQRISQDFPLDVTLNGGITGYSQLEQQLCQAGTPAPLDASCISSYMAGRWMLRRPLDLAAVQYGFLDDKSLMLLPPSDAGLAAVKDYTSYVMSCVQSSSDSVPTLNDLCLPLFIISEQLREDYEYEERADSNVHSNVTLDFEAMEGMYDCICETVQWLQEFRRAKQTRFSPDAMEFNKLSSSFKSLVGTKVAGKWKRNRSEL